MGVNAKLIQTNAKLDAIYSRLGDTNAYLQTLGQIYNTEQDIHATLATLSGFLQNAIGDPNEATRGTMLYALYSIQQCICALAEGVPPNPDDPAGCADPLVQDSIIASDDYAGAIFALWPLELPQGINVASFLAHPVVGAEISISAPDGASVYVQSAKAANFSPDPEQSAVYPTNTWVPFPTGASLAINVPADSDIKAFICVAAGFFDCTTRSDVPATQDFYVSATDEHIVSHNRYANLTGLGLETSDTYALVNGSLTVTLSVSGSLILGNVVGWQVKPANAQNIRAVWVPGDGLSFHTQPIAGTATTFFTIPEATQAFWIDNNYDQGSGDHTTVIEAEICPPSA